MARDYYLGPNVYIRNYAQRDHEEYNREVQSEANAGGTLQVMNEHQQQNDVGREMELDDGAMAPALKAPRAQ
jgi:hypothetical protein